MAKKMKEPMADLRASMRRMQADGEELLGRMRRDARALIKSGRAEFVRDVRTLTGRADRTLRTLEARVLNRMHAATTDQMKRLERRLMKLEQAVATLERRAPAETAA